MSGIEHGTVDERARAASAHDARACTGSSEASSHAQGAAAAETSNIVSIVDPRAIHASAIGDPRFSQRTALVVPRVLGRFRALIVPRALVGCGTLVGSRMIIVPRAVVLPRALVALPAVAVRALVVPRAITRDLASFVDDPEDPLRRMR